MSENDIVLNEPTLEPGPIAPIAIGHHAHLSHHLHVTRDVDGLPIPHPAEQPRHVIERALNNAGIVQVSETPQVEVPVEHPEYVPDQPIDGDPALTAERVTLPAEEENRERAGWQEEAHD